MDSVEHPEDDKWTVKLHPLFNKQRQALIDKAIALKSRLTEKEYRTHSDVKRLAAIERAISQLIPENPMQARFMLRSPLDKFQRLKGFGIGDRYRLFFKAIPEIKTVVVLWLGYPRRDGDKKKDCYQVFKKKIERGEVPTDVSKLVDECDP